MKESYSEDLASHAGPESCAGVREGVGEALTGVCAGPVLSLEKLSSGVPTQLTNAEGHIPCSSWREPREPHVVRDLSMHRNTLRGSREISVLPSPDGSEGREGKSEDVIQR